MCSDLGFLFYFFIFLKLRFCHNVFSLPWASWLAGQLQFLSVAGRSNPGSWQALRSLLLLETGWKPGTYSVLTIAVFLMKPVLSLFDIQTTLLSYDKSQMFLFWCSPPALPPSAGNNLHCCDSKTPFLGFWRGIEFSFCWCSSCLRWQRALKLQISSLLAIPSCLLLHLQCGTLLWENT